MARFYGIRAKETGQTGGSGYIALLAQMPTAGPHPTVYDLDRVLSGLPRQSCRPIHHVLLQHLRELFMLSALTGGFQGHYTIRYVECMQSA